MYARARFFQLLLLLYLRPSSDEIMVLLWRGNRSQQTERVFDGSGDVNTFLFDFKNELMNDKDTSDKSLELITHLDGEAFQQFLDKFSDNKNLNDDA